MLTSFSFLREFLLLVKPLRLRSRRVLDREAPDICVETVSTLELARPTRHLTEEITNRNDDIHHKASVHSYGQAKTREHERDLVNTFTQCTWPAKTDVVLNDRSARIDNSPDQRQDEDVLVRERRFR